MKNLFLVLISCLFTATAGLSRDGKVYDDLSLKSKLLKSDWKYAVYLPSDYESSARSYPVLYLLHGMGDDQTGWIQFGEVLHIADKAIKEGKATAMIIVMPDAHTGGPGYFNDPAGERPYEDFFFEEFIPYIEKTYRIKSEKRYRAVAGLSMGGGGAFMYALHRPDMFSSACPLSAYIGALSFDEFKERQLKNGATYADTLLRAYYERHNALCLVNKKPKEEMASVRWFIDCGDDDFLYEGNSLIHIALRKKEIAHEYRVRDGGHSWTYWRASLPEVLEFISAAFHQY
ncbi:MAG: hypothetical protein JXR46_14670 [Calditrichaceae bacterium]|nr:hypothetical protein [Calditrichaceae bacterium]MBN2710284.1 hypothetical protein [Calditrichaceae bacterium]RQV93903.1 MAG: esterase family protein [Calditrichota bacterium]